MARNTWVGANRSVAVTFWFVKFGFEKNQKGRKKESGTKPLVSNPTGLRSKQSALLQPHHHSIQIHKVAPAT